MQIINAPTFEVTETETFPSGNLYERGTVEVTLGGETRRVKAGRCNGRVVAYGFGGRYRAGGKVWPASVHQTEKGGEYVDFGRDDRSGRFQKSNAIFFI